jgi:hypothetical protein
LVSVKFRLLWLRFFRVFSSVVRQMPGYSSQRRGTVRTLQFVNCVVLRIVCVDCVVLCIVCVLMCTVLLPLGVNPTAVKYIVSNLHSPRHEELWGEGSGGIAPFILNLSIRSGEWLTSHPGERTQVPTEQEAWWVPLNKRLGGSHWTRGLVSSAEQEAWWIPLNKRLGESHWTRTLVGPRAGLNFFFKENNFLLLPVFETRTVQPLD